MRLSTLMEKAISLFPKSKQLRALIQPFPGMGLTLLLLLGMTRMTAQESVTDIFNLPEPERCVSNDLRVVEASLEFDMCGPTCEPGEIITYPLTLAIFNNTGSERTSFAFFARLEQYDPDGNLAKTYFITGCKGPVPPNTTTSITFDESLEIFDEEGNPTILTGVPYLCGGSLKLINLYEAWTDASDNDNRVCPLEPSKINPKCGVLQSIEIQTPINAFVDSTADVSCFEGSDGAIDITVTGGEEPFNFVWSKTGGGFSASTEDVSGLSAGTYSVNITDANGCPAALEGIVIGEPTELQATQTSLEDASCFGLADGSIAISVTGGTPSYTYLWTGPDGYSATTEDISGLEAGSYSVTVTDARGCTDVISGLIVGEPAELVASLDESEDASCFGFADGSISIEVEGGTEPYSYVWTGPGSFTAITEDISGLEAGSYSVTVTDANDCTDDISGIQIGEPDELVASEVSVTDASCAGFATGAIDISVEGGTPPYTYLWNNNATTQDLSAIGAGIYSVTVTDAKGCEDTLEDIEVDDPSSLEASVTTVTDVSCFGFEDAAIDINVQGGTPPYSFEWTGSDGFSATTEDISGIGAGSYSVTITDDHDCSLEIPGILVEEPDELIASLDESEDASCFGSADGSISISVVGGTSPYSFAWTGSDGFTAGIEDISGLEAGSYSVTVTDANNCTDQITGILIGEPDELVAAVVSVTDASCAGSSTGAIDISVTGGTSPYTYLWSNTATTQDLSGIGAGTYSVTVTDANGCEDSLQDIEVDDPSSLDVTATLITNMSCFGVEDGAINISVTGGTSPYSYLWSNGATTEDVSGLDAGTYSVTVTDDHDCTFTLGDLVVGEPDQVPSPEVQVAPADCFPTGGSFSIVGSSAELQYSLDNGPWFTYTGTLTDVDPGEHSLKARDANGCVSDPLMFDVPQPFEVPTAPGVTAIQPDCESLTGTIVVTSATAGFRFSINGGDFVAYPAGGFSGLAPGDYTVKAQTSDGCISDITNINLEEPVCDDFEGCTLGYWKNHTDRWCDSYLTCDIYGEIFPGAPSQLASLSLLEVLNLGGGGIYNLGRQSVAALLNACSEDVNYELETPQDVIAYVTANFSNAGAAGSHLDMLNQAGCTLGGSKATKAASEACETAPSSTQASTKQAKGDEAGFTVFPVPFRNNLTIRYEFDYKSEAVIQIFDMRGNLVKTHKEQRASSGKTTTINADFVRGQQLYLIKVTTDRGTSVRSVVSGK